MIEAVGFFFLFFFLSLLPSCLALVMTWGVLEERGIASRWTFEMDWTEWRIGRALFVRFSEIRDCAFIRLVNRGCGVFLIQILVDGGGLN